MQVLQPFFGRNRGARPNRVELHVGVAAAMSRHTSVTFKRRVRARMSKTGERYATAAQAPGLARALHEGRFAPISPRPNLAARDQLLEAHRRGAFVLWFEADLYDPLQLIQVVQTSQPGACSKPRRRTRLRPSTAQRDGACHSGTR